MPWHSDILQYAFAFKRAIVTPYTFTTVLLPAVFSFYAMAILVQLPRTGFYRSALLPVLIWLCFRANKSLDLSWNHPGYAYLNQGLALCMFTIAMRSTTFVLAQRPYSRSSICKLGHSTTNGNNRYNLVEQDVSISSAMCNALDLLMNIRGIGWDGPQRISLPTPSLRTESRPLFALVSFCRFTLLALAYDALTMLACSLGRSTFGRPEGGTIFDTSLSPPQRYLKSSIISLCTGIWAYLLLDGLYHFNAALFTMVFRQRTSQWPPLFDSPWLSTSLNSLWGRRWHQYFRESFLTVGGKPLERYLGRVGTVMGAFAVSALLHVVGVQGMDRGTDTMPVALFFLMQGVGVVLEHAWKQLTGRRVGGLLGWAWMCFWLLLWGHGLVDAWAKSGLLGSEYGPEAYRPSTLVLTWIFRK